MLKYLSILFLFFTYLNCNSQGLSLSELTFYLNPDNFSKDSILISKDFKGEFRVLSEQETMYTYDNYKTSNTRENIYYGGITQYDGYKTYQISYFFESDSIYNNLLRELEACCTNDGLNHIRSCNWYNNEKENYFVKLYKDLIRIYSYNKYSFSNLRILPGHYNAITNTFVEKTESYNINPFDENNLAIVSHSSFLTKGLIDKSGKLIALPDYDYIEYISHAYYIVGKFQESNTDDKTVELKYGLIDSKGEEILPIKYDKIEMQKDEYIVVEEGGKSSIAFYLK